jgi:hypothetical protein
MNSIEKIIVFKFGRILWDRLKRLPFFIEGVVITLIHLGNTCTAFSFENYNTATEPSSTPEQIAIIITRTPRNVLENITAWNFYEDNYSGESVADSLSCKAGSNELEIGKNGTPAHQTYAYYFDQNYNLSGIAGNFFVSYSTMIIHSK